MEVSLCVPNFHPQDHSPHRTPQSLHTLLTGYPKIKQGDQRKESFRHLGHKKLQVILVIVWQLHPHRLHAQERWDSILSLSKESLAFSSSRLNDFKLKIELLPSKRQRSAGCRTFGSFRGVRNTAGSSLNVPVSTWGLQLFACTELM